MTRTDNRTQYLCANDTYCKNVLFFIYDKIVFSTLFYFYFLSTMCFIEKMDKQIYVFYKS